MVIEFSMLKNAKGPRETEAASRFPVITWAGILLRACVLALSILLIPAPSYADIDADLLDATRKGDINKVNLLLDKGVDVNATNAINDTALLFAAWKGHLDIAKVLIAHGANVNLADYTGQTPLTLASTYGHIKIAKVLLDKGAFIDARTRTGVTPLMRAAINGNGDIVKLLLAHGADPTLRSNAIMAGTWKGSVIRQGSEPVPISLTLSDVGAGEKAGTWATPGCTGSLVMQGAENGIYSYETLSNCGEAFRTRITPQGKGESLMELLSSNGSRMGHATLNKETYIDYAGYSESFLPVKWMLDEGKLDNISSVYAAQDESVKKKVKGDEADFMHEIGTLGWLERGTLAVDSGKFDEAEKCFSNAEWTIEEKSRESKVGGFFKKVWIGAAETLSGVEGLGPYDAEGWEKVVMLNYKSIAYLLQGDRRAYNVTRRAIDWQNIEKKAFDQKLLEEKKKLSKKLAQKKSSKRETSSQGIESGLLGAFSKMDVKASTVPSAYVNPFGFYVQGLVQEFESYNDRSLRDNARISYEKALELNPDSKVLKQAVDDLGKPAARDGSRIVQIVIADGFVPEKQVLTYNVQIENMIIPLKLPIYTPSVTDVHRIEVYSESGKRLATLSTVADIEALCLRQQKDRQQVLMLRALADFAVASVMTSVGQKGEGLLGAIVKGISDMRKESSAPDTRSWMSLPATIQAARLHLRRGVKQLKIVSFDKAGKKLATKTVQIDPDNHQFIYARSLDKTLYTQSADDLWVAKL